MERELKLGMSNFEKKWPNFYKMLLFLLMTLTLVGCYETNHEIIPYGQGEQINGINLGDYYRFDENKQGVDEKLKDEAFELKWDRNRREYRYNKKYINSPAKYYRAKKICKGFYLLQTSHTNGNYKIYMLSTKVDGLLQIVFPVNERERFLTKRNNLTISGTRTKPILNGTKQNIINYVYDSANENSLKSPVKYLSWNTIQENKKNQQVLAGVVVAGVALVSLADWISESVSALSSSSSSSSAPYSSYSNDRCWEKNAICEDGCKKMYKQDYGLIMETDYERCMGECYRRKEECLGN